MCFIIVKFHCEVHCLMCHSWQEENYQFTSKLNKKLKPKPLLRKGQQLPPYNCDKDVSTGTFNIIYIFICLIFAKAFGSMPQETHKFIHSAAGNSREEEISSWDM